MECREVLFGFLGGGSSQTFVILDLPTFCVVDSCPSLILWDREESLLLVTFGGFYNGCDEFLYEVVHF